MFSDVAISVANIGKCFHLYDKPRDRLLQMLVGGRKKYYREFWAVRDISFEVRKGETVAIIGKNGSGKSTLLQMICGTVAPTVGDVRVVGRVAALLELGAGFNVEFTGRENVLLSAAILGFSREKIEAQMEKILEFSELGGFLDQPVKTYSSGMYARLAFATAIHVEPDILVVDEALAVGDARFVAKCMRRIKEIQSAGAAILFVSHDVASIRTLCETAIWINQGKIRDQGNVFSITGRYMEFMFADDDDINHPNYEREDYLQGVKSSANEEQDAAYSLGLVATPDAGLAQNSGSTNVMQCAIAQPITHWGSHKGLVTTAAVRDECGNRKDIFPWGASIEVVISVRIPREISRDHLCIAFSIKDLKGTDLIVSTTRDFTSRRLPDAEDFMVSFRFQNPLVTGKYLLVAAVEERQHRDPHYYEYVEGAHYFSSISDNELFGLFQPKILQTIEAS